MFMKKLITLAMTLGMGISLMAQNQLASTDLHTTNTSSINNFGYLDLNRMYEDDDDDRRRRRRRRSKGGRAGNHWGLHFTPGLGNPGTTTIDGELFFATPSFSFEFAGDFVHFFSEHWGVKSGLKYTSLSSSSEIMTFDENFNMVNSEQKANIGTIGIPVNLVVATNQSVGFYGEIGFGFNFPIASNFEQDGEEIEDVFETSGFVMTFNQVYGVHFAPSDNLSLNVGFSYNLGLNKYYDVPDTEGFPFLFDVTPGFNWGFQLGMTMKLN